jgi:hypothetical protein
MQNKVDFVIMEIQGANFEVMCHELKKVKKDELLTNLDMLYSKLIFNALRLRFYEEIKLLVNDYLDEIIILAENFDKYEKYPVVKLILFWINLYCYKKDPENNSKIQKAITFFNENVLINQGWNVNIFSIIKGTKDQNTQALFKNFLFVSSLSILDEKIFSRKNQTNLLIAEIFYLYSELKSFLQKISSTDFQFKSVSFCYDTRNKKNPEILKS